MIDARDDSGSDRPGTSGVIPFFIELAPSDIALLKFLFESYEGVAVIRTIDREAAVIVAIVSPDFEDVARQMLDSLRDSISFRLVPPPAAARRDWLAPYIFAGAADDDVSPGFSAPS